MEEVKQEVSAWLSKQPNLPEEQRRVEKLLSKRLNRPGGREVYELRRRVWEEYLALLPYARAYAREHKYIAELRDYWTRIQSFINYLSKKDTELTIKIDEGNITEIKLRATAAARCATLGDRYDFPLLAAIQTDLCDAGYFLTAKNRVAVFRWGDDDAQEVRAVIQAVLGELSNSKVVGGLQRAKINSDFLQRVMPLYMFLLHSNVFKRTIREGAQLKDTTDFLAELFNEQKCKDIKNFATKTAK
jgi:hypothetical protein